MLLIKHLLPRSAALTALVLLATACSKTEDVTPVTDTSNDNLLLGNPSGAASSTSSPTNYLLVKTQYATGYNRDQGKPIWVSWHLAQPDLGSAPRQANFRADPALLNGWYQVKPSEYSGYGVDRGHHCPSADRTATVGNNDVSRVSSSTRVIAVNTPHDNGLSLAWGGYCTSGDAIEAASGTYFQRCQWACRM